MAKRDTPREKAEDVGAMNFYNDIEPHAAAWLDNLQRADEIPNGNVDRRSIADLSAADVAGYAGVHFFAGIGGWPLALRLAGWPDDRAVWTGSCPCQPFSAAGKRKGEADARHLWPEYARLIGECRPTILFGEQVASADGRAWLARVRLDLEGMGYAVGAADLCSAGIGAPHIRQRLYFGAVRLGDADHDGRETGRSASAAMGYGRALDTASRARGFGMADAANAIRRPVTRGVGAVQGESESTPRGRPIRERNGGAGSYGPETDCHHDGWRNAEWLACKDGKSRRVKSGVPLLVDGLPRNVAGALAGFGNAIVPPLAAQFVRAFCEAVGETL
jgi:DNA (cytosine-5)-methyltransferase 1